jgi:hypothetical protein
VIVPDDAHTKAIHPLFKQDVVRKTGEIASPQAGRVEVVSPRRFRDGVETGLQLYPKF